MEKKYQIFISSTFTDLREERSNAIFQILNLEHFPIGMEMFKPTDKKQWNTIKNTIDSSDAYLLIVGFRYGTVDLEKAMSFTEMEFNYALSKKIPIIIFVMTQPKHYENIIRLEELKNEGRLTAKESAELADLYSSHYDADQQKIRSFRDKVMRDRIVKIFSTDPNSRPEEKFDVSGAIIEVVKTNPNGGWTQRKKNRWYFLRQVYFYMVLILLMGTISMLYATSGVGTLQYKLKSADTGVFSSPQKDTRMEYARVIPDDNALASETNFAATIKSTEHTFDMFSNAFSTLVANQTVVDSCLKRGVNFRILLVDTATERVGKKNEVSIYELNESKIETRRIKVFGDFINTVRIVGDIRDLINNNHWSGKIYVRVYKKPMTFQMWLKDARYSNGLAHFCIPYYDNFKGIFRVSTATSPRLMKNMAAEFDKFWSDPENVEIYK